MPCYVARPSLLHRNGSYMLWAKGGGKSFQVVDGKKSCEFEFDVANKAWTGGCK